MSYVIFDIETAPRPLEELKAIIPPFNPADVAVGNLKDPEKIKAKLADAEANHMDSFLRRSALSAQTGRVLCIGYLLNTGSVDISEGDEKEQLAKFWALWTFSGEVPFIGWNCRKFDLPFLVRRSWMLGVKVAADLVKGRYQTDRCVDAMEVWGVGAYDSEAGSSSLNAVSRALGFAGKTGSGADFGNTYVAGADGRKKALEYLKQDLLLTRDVAAKIGIIELKEAA